MKLAALLATALLGPLVSACDGHGAAAGASCPPSYMLRVAPRTIVSNERHTLRIAAYREACSSSRPVRGGSVALGHQRATTDALGKARLTVRLQTGRYLIRLSVHGRVVARARVSAIPNVSR